MRVGLIGLGAINTRVAQTLLEGAEIRNATLVAVLVQDVPKHHSKEWLGVDVLLTDSFQALLEANCDVVVEVPGVLSLQCFTS